VAYTRTVPNLLGSVRVFAIFSTSTGFGDDSSFVGVPTSRIVPTRRATHYHRFSPADGRSAFSRSLIANVVILFHSHLVSRRTARSVDTSAPVTVVSASTASIQVVVVTPVVSTTTVS
jgi:hypothetical protein